MRIGLELTLAGLAGALLTATTRGAPGDPVALRWWGEQRVSIETMHGLEVALRGDPGDSAPDLTVLARSPEPGRERIEGPVRWAVADSTEAISVYKGVDAIVDRRANEARASVSENPSGVPGRNAIRVRSFPTRTSIGTRANNPGSSLGAMLLVEVDGVRILDAGPLGVLPGHEALGEFGEIDVLIVHAESDATRRDLVLSFIEQTSPRIVVALAGAPDAHKVIDRFVADLPERFERRRSRFNTLAVSADRGPSSREAWVVTLSRNDWSPSGRLAELFKEKEAASRASQEVFRPLTADQMNHKPSNGTHTPRWNVEHMSGTEMLFFSGVYSNLDPSIGQVRRMPAQMPATYKAREADWDGAEEARWMENVQRFVHRFGYLLEDVELDSLPAGCPPFVRNLEGLFIRMHDHYDEHTQHVKEKFEQPDWPGS